MAIAISGATIAQQHDQQKHEDHQGQVKSITSLTPQLQDLLRQEMQAIDASMQQILTAFARGEWQQVEHQAKQIKNSFILKQKLTKSQRHELHEKLPSRFIEMDQSFHYYAGMLAHTAEKRKTELVSFYIAKMSEACANCHSQFATHRFPGFVAEETDHHH